MPAREGWQPVSGFGYEGWCIDAPASAAEWRSSIGGVDIFIVGTWFGRRAGLDSLDAVARRIARDGIDAVASVLEGAFALIVCDPKRRAISVATDAAGTMHVFVARYGTGWAISTSSAWMAAITRATLDPIGVHEFVATGIVYEDRTLWEGVRKIGQACVTSLYADGTSDERRYWSFADITPERDDFATSIVRLVEAMKSAAEAIGDRYPRVLCDITSGYDSRATIAAFMIADVPFEGTVSGPDDSRDVVISKAIAARFGIAHRHASAVLRRDRAELEDAVELTDGECMASDYARIAAIHRGHAAAYDISVNGSFGELARGYWWELLWPSIGAREPLDSGMLALRRFAAVAYDRSIFSDADFDLVGHMRGVIDRVNGPLRGMPNTTLMDHAYFALRMHRWQGRIASSTMRIWPNVSLFGFRSVLEPVLEAKAASRIRSGLMRSLLARYLPALANYPLEGGYPSTPATVSNLHRFWPIVPHYARRVTTKLVPHARGRSSTYESLPGPTPSEVELLIASRVFAPDALRALLQRPPTSPQQARLLTLGVVLRKVSGSVGNAAPNLERAAVR